jgi:pyrroloquinoline quinone (PQQ) biosynthesis protein C
MDAKTFLKGLRKKVETHTAVNHPLLARVAHVPFTREDYKIFSLQHYALVGNFTTYLEYLLLSAPDSDAKQWIAKVLVDEYGEGSDGKDHAELYREYLYGSGVKPGEEYETKLHRAVTGFIAEHLRICRDEPFLVGLGAVGPGHEWSIPKMFPPIVQGLRNAGYTEDEILYFTLHMEQDEDHGLWLEEALELYASTYEAQQEILRGTMLSLEARARFWSGVQDKIVRWRQPNNINLRSQMRREGHDQYGEMTLSQWQKKVSEAGLKSMTHA